MAGVYVRPTSKYFWICMPGRRGKRESTQILVNGPTPAQTRENRRLAELAYHARMRQVAEERYLLNRQRFTPSNNGPNGKPPQRLQLRRQKGGWCYVYFVQRDHAVKIGRCVDVRHRLMELQTGSSEPLVLLATTLAHSALEEAIHERFDYLRRTGEWFDLVPELRTYIDGVAAGLNPVALLWAKP